MNKEQTSTRLINNNYLNTIFLKNTNILAKFISDLTKIPYQDLKDNILINITNNPIHNKKYKYFVKIDNKILSKKSYIISLYSNLQNHQNNYLIIQININLYQNNTKNYYDLFQLQNNKGEKYIENFKIYTLDIIKCYDLYYNKKKNNNIIKWGTFFYSKTNYKELEKIISNLINKKDLTLIKQILKEEP